MHDMLMDAGAGAIVADVLLNYFWDELRVRDPRTIKGHWRAGRDRIPAYIADHRRINP